MSFRRRNTNKKQGSGRQNGRRELSNPDGLTVKTMLGVKRENSFSFVRTATSAAIPWSGSTGFGAGSQDVTMSFSLQNTIIQVGGVISQTVTTPGYAELVNLFELYRIDKVEASFMWNANSFAPGTTTGMPILNICFDPDSSATRTLSDVSQFENLRVVQLGNLRRESGFVVSFVPRINYQTFASGYVVPEKPVWVATTSSATPHYALVAVMDPAGVTGATPVGNLSIYFRYFFTVKDTK